jgi:enamine deaminase RidA (YjgF/YER057c/UK114 family)
MPRIVKVKTGNRLEDISSYSRIVAVGDWIFVSNTAGRNPQTKEIPSDVIAQTHQVFDNIEGALKSVGACLGDVIATQVFIQDPADVPGVMKIFGQKFRGVDPALTATCPSLGSTIYKVEIEVTAFRGAAAAEVEKLSISL